MGHLREFGRTMEHSKTEIFDFYRHKSPCDIPPLDLGFSLPPLSSKCTWRYLGIYFDRQLTFKEHVKFYTTKSISAAKCMRILGNSVRGLTPKLKRLLYISCILPVATYGLRCWYNPKKRGIKGLIKLLRNTHRVGSLWVTGAFRTSPVGAVAALSGLMPMHLTLRKLFERSIPRLTTLHRGHPVLSHLHKRHSKGSKLHPLSLEFVKVKSKRARLHSPLDIHVPM